MKRRAFLGACILPALAQVEKPQRAEKLYPEQQHPESERGRGIADFARSLHIRRGLTYAHRPEAELTLDIYSPAERSRPMPGILAFALAAFKKNGAEFRLDLENLPPSPTPNLYPPILARDRVVVVARVRVSAEAMFPAQIHDAKCALRWMRKNARDLGIDPERIALFGASASGNLISLLALTDGGQLDDATCMPGVSTRVKAVCSLSGIYDFELYARDPGNGSLFVDAIPPYLGMTDSLYRQASPAHYVHSGARPFFLTHGREDQRVPYSQMPHFARLLRAKGVSVETWTIHHYEHGAMPGKEPDPGYAATDQAIYRFLDRMLSS